MERVDRNGLAVDARLARFVETAAEALEVIDSWEEPC